MPNQRAANVVQFTLRLTQDWVTRIEAVGRKISPSGVVFRRNDAIRAIIARGLESFEAELKAKK